MLFADIFVNNKKQFCTSCHRGNDAYQAVATNYPYCVTFGGYPGTYYSHIKRQIGYRNSKPVNCGSRHNMTKIRKFVRNDNNGWGFGADPSPCVACHHPHTAQRNHPVSIVEGKLNTAIRRAADYKSTDPGGMLWGDDADERMSHYVSLYTDGVYQAPYYGDTSGTRYEPSGNAGPSDGSDLPDYVTFCLDCHAYEQYDPDRDRTVKAIDYDQERHGTYPSNTCSPFGGVDEGALRAPYFDFANSNYILSCLDCHEPHGAKKRMHLLRRMINGQRVGLDSKDPYGNCYDDLAVICEKCHAFTGDHLSWGGCITESCHGSGLDSTFHGGMFGYPNYPPECDGGPSF
jgi:hypothetical protein